MGDQGQSDSLMQFLSMLSRATGPSPLSLPRAVNATGLVEFDPSQRVGNEAESGRVPFETPDPNAAMRAAHAIAVLMGLAPMAGEQLGQYWDRNYPGTLPPSATAYPRRDSDINLPAQEVGKHGR